MCFADFLHLLNDFYRPFCLLEKSLILKRLSILKHFPLKGLNITKINTANLPGWPYVCVLKLSFNVFLNDFWPHIMCKCHPPTSVAVQDHLLRDQCSHCSQYPDKHLLEVRFTLPQINLCQEPILELSPSLLAPPILCVWEGHCSSSWLRVCLRTRSSSGDGSAREARGGERGGVTEPLLHLMTRRG